MAVGASSTNEAVPREEVIGERGPGFSASPGSPALTISPSQQLWRLWMLRRAFQTAEPHLKPEPAGRSQLLNFSRMARAPVQICSYSGMRLVLYKVWIFAAMQSPVDQQQLSWPLLGTRTVENATVSEGVCRSEGAPKPICHTVSPLRTPVEDSMRDQAYLHSSTDCPLNSRYIHIPHNLTQLRYSY